MNYGMQLLGFSKVLMQNKLRYFQYLLGKRNELKLKKHELRKDQYLKLIKTFENVFSGALQKDRKGNFVLNEKMKKEWFDMGSSLFIYGSRKVYKLYVFYRSYESNPLLKNSKYKNDEMSLFMMAKIFNQMRKEIGLNSFEGTFKFDSLAFFVNDISYNPLSKIKYYKSRYYYYMMKTELFLIDRIKFVYLKKMFYTIISPIFSVIGLFFKYFLMIPLGRIIMRLFPKFAEKLNKSEEDTQND